MASSSSYFFSWYSIASGSAINSALGCCGGPSGGVGGARAPLATTVISMEAILNPHYKFEEEEEGEERREEEEEEAARRDFHRASPKPLL